MPSPPPRGASLVKICGVTRPADAAFAVAAGADLVGLNFWPGSPRRVDAGAAREIAAAVAGRAGVVGVFVDASPRWIEATAAAVGLDLVQLHGEEGPLEVEAFGGRAIKVFRVAERLDRAALAGYPLAWGFLFDVRRAGRFGGTGEAWPYEWIAGVADPRPRLLAGGVRPGTARAALAASGASGVDVCSGVETAPGIKDPDLVRRLLAEVKGAGAAA